MSTIYLNAGYDGSIYQTSKTPAEGFDAHVSTKGNTSYRKVYMKGLYGFYQSVELRNSKIGQQLSIHMVDQDENNVYLQLPFKDQRGGISTFAESFLCKLPFLTEKTLYRLYAYNIPVEGTTYKKIGLSIKLASDWENVINEPKVGQLSYTYTKDNVLHTGDIPAVNWIPQFDGTKKLDSADKDNYLYSQVLLKYAKTAPVAPTTTGTTTTATAPVTQQPMTQNTAPVVQQQAQQQVTQQAPPVQAVTQQAPQTQTVAQPVTQAVQYVAPPIAVPANTDLPF